MSWSKGNARHDYLRLSGTESGPYAAWVTCLSHYTSACADIFWSPDRRRIRRCPKCRYWLQTRGSDRGLNEAVAGVVE